jgi:D-alanine-D-alanine ligase
MVLLTALVCSKKRKCTDKPVDFYAECDSETTLQAIENALKSSSSKVTVIEADKNAYTKLKNAKIDIVFNIAEGLYGESRESHIPAMLEMLRIPYTGSGVLTLALTLDKAKTKEILLANKIPTPRFQVFS